MESRFVINEKLHVTDNRLEVGRLFSREDMKAVEEVRIAGGLAVIYTARSPCKESANEDAALLGPCCAEFVNYRQEFPETMWHYKDNRHRFDLWHISSDQLQAAGISKANLYISKICTKCRTDLFFSYRAQTVTGRFASVIGLR